MTKTIGTKVTDELYSKVLAKCSGLACTPSHYLKTLIEANLSEAESKKEEPKKEETPKTQKELENEEFERWLNTPAEKPKDDLDK